MPKNFNRLVRCAGLALLITSVAGIGAAAAEDTLATIKQKGVVTVGTEAAFPPFEFVQDGKIVGYGKDVLDSIVKGLGVKLNQLDVPFDGLYPGLLSGKWDFIATTLLEWENPAKKFAMTYPIAEGSTAILTRKGDGRIKSAQDFNGRVIATQVGTGSAIRLRGDERAAQEGGKAGLRLQAVQFQPRIRRGTREQAGRRRSRPVAADPGRGEETAGPVRARRSCREQARISWLGDTSRTTSACGTI